MDKKVESLEALGKEAQAFIQGLKPKPGEATLVTLTGELGAGKTAFVKAVAKVLGVGGHVTSPTFVLEKIYELTDQKFQKLIHIDAYRLENESPKPLNLSVLMKEPGNLIMLEWPERIREALPAPAVAIALRAEPDGSRVISYA